MDGQACEKMKKNFKWR